MGGPQTDRPILLCVSAHVRTVKGRCISSCLAAAAQQGHIAAPTFERKRELSRVTGAEMLHLRALRKGSKSLRLAPSEYAHPHY
jgi:hypothetical protein